MWQFIRGSDAAFTTLEERARHSCVRFRDQEMPPGATPARATVAFEINPVTGVASLLVDRGVRYNGPSDELLAWFQSGQRSFDSFAALRSWLVTKLRAAFLPQVTPPSAVPGVNTEKGVEDGSDLDLDDLDAKALQIALRRLRREDDPPS